MSVSLNEVEAAAKRAARGAGYPWGLAEEAGKSTRWLCGQGMDGANALAQLLRQGLAAALEDHRPVAKQPDWIGQHALCPLITGAALSDRPDLLRAGPIRLQSVAVPVLIIPFVAFAARAENMVISVISGSVSATTNGRQLASVQDWPAHAECLEILPGGDIGTSRSQAPRAIPDPADWATLDRFAHRTYAPATEESRLRGAGAGLSDND